jgi:hypothetical protein
MWTAFGVPTTYFSKIKKKIILYLSDECRSAGATLYWQNSLHDQPVPNQPGESLVQQMDGFH